MGEETPEQLIFAELQRLPPVLLSNFVLGTKKERIFDKKRKLVPRPQSIQPQNKKNELQVALTRENLELYR
jgi:hypothetical protein